MSITPIEVFYTNIVAKKVVKINTSECFFGVRYGISTKAVHQGAVKHNTNPDTFLVLTHAAIHRRYKCVCQNIHFV